MTKKAAASTTLCFIECISGRELLPTIAAVPAVRSCKGKQIIHYAAKSKVKAWHRIQEERTRVFDHVCVCACASERASERPFIFYSSSVTANGGMYDGLLHLLIQQQFSLLLAMPKVHLERPLGSDFSLLFPFPIFFFFFFFFFFR